IVKKQKLFINGEWKEAGEYHPLYSPYNGEILAQIPKASIKETEEAIDAAVSAKSAMKKLTAYERSEILLNLVRLLEENAE
ncbi:aldehyde dehydrogenase family protein, partial [Salipaludibacillus sp. CF4.18]|uniref:aldehyde dehydrogenase family protein n=1 Tax=Salipaludibacillus sp. CF4.18 TaxID=3373081 RepID=UPI003EE61868